MNNDPDFLNPYNDDIPEADLSIFDKEKPMETVVIQPTENNQVAEVDISELEKLPGANIKFKLVDDQSNKIVSLKEVEEQLLGDGTIDKTRAVVINESFGDLFSDYYSQNSYTKIPTKVNYNETRSYISSKISVEEQILIDLYNTYLQEPFETINVILAKIKEKYLPGLIRITESLISELKTNINKIINNNNTVIPVINKEFINLAQIDLLTLDVNNFHTNLKTIAIFKESISVIQKVFQCQHTKKFIYFILIEIEGGASVSNRHLDESIHEKGCCNNSISMIDLTNFILHKDLIDRLNLIFEAICKDQLYINDLVKQASGLSSKPDELAGFVVKHANHFIDFHNKVTMFTNLVSKLTYLNLSIKQMLLTFLEL